jgi:hypothetical protein
LALSVTETVLFYVVIPLVAVLVITGLAMAGGSRGAKRYRPGRSYDFTPVWFLSSPEQLTATNAVAALPAGAHRAELTSDPHVESGGAAVRAGTTGGASDRW